MAAGSRERRLPVSGPSSGQMPALLRLGEAQRTCLPACSCSVLGLWYPRGASGLAHSALRAGGDSSHRLAEREVQASQQEP